MAQQHRPRKRFGQHFLIDEQIIQSIVNAIIPRQDDLIVEIGPGPGALTRPLIERVAQLHVIELDRDLARNLRERYSTEKLQIHEMDVLRMDFAELIKNSLAPYKKLKVVGNLPYNISTPLIFHLLDSIELVDDMVFMVQKEVADRMAASAGNKAYGRLSVMLQYACETELLFDVPPDAFDPPPKVMSSVIRLLPRQKPLALQDHELFSKLVKQAFSQRRKTLRNVLKGLASSDDLIAVDIKPEARSETISLDQFVRLANYLSDQSQG